MYNTTKLSVFVLQVIKQLVAGVEDDYRIAREMALLHNLDEGAGRDFDYVDPPERPAFLDAINAVLNEH
ncbi:hypothetical protein [Chitinophaga rhizosphaerae]|uniref:hypothetical protein n=1 Tax=Chitinophaga rhizosphaerae TaxID=1864947 RepID=UPI000F815B1C|nr:hypothetical protein [Chitinophaga rhizosphaerae]